MTLKVKLRIYLAILIFSILSGAFLIFIGSLYLLSNQSLNTSLLAEANELIRTHLVVSDNQIFLRRDDKGNSLSAYLRDEDLSAIILDQNKIVVASYGAFHDFVPPVISDKLTPKYESIIFSGGNYKMVTLPIINDGKSFGTILLAKTDFFRNTTLPLSVTVAVVTVIVSVVLVWIIGGKLLTLLIAPLDDLVFAMKLNTLDNLQTIPLKKDYPFEIVTLSSNYNHMFNQLSDDLNLQEQFISSASHEIKTPITSAISSLDLLSMDIADGSYKRLETRLKTVKSQLSSLSNLVGQLLTISSLKLKYLPSEKINLVEFINKVVISRRGEIEDKKITVKVNISPEYTINFPETHLYLIVDNLIGNAIKYNHHNGVIGIEVKKGQHSLCLLISDTGIGIPESEREQIFERFYRSNNGRYKSSGHGLGLSIVKDICNLHHLDLQVQSIVNQGTVFQIAGIPL